MKEGETLEIISFGSAFLFHFVHFVLGVYLNREVKIHASLYGLEAPR